MVDSSWDRIAEGEVSFENAFLLASTDLGQALIWERFISFYLAKLYCSAVAGYGEGYSLEVEKRTRNEGRS